MSRRRSALLAGLLLLVPTGCEEPSPPAPGATGLDTAEEAEQDQEYPETAEVEAELAALAGVTAVDASVNPEDTEVYYSSLSVRVADDADATQLTTVLERAEELGSEVLAEVVEDQTSFLGGDMVVGDDRLTVSLRGPGEGVEEESADARVERVLAAYDAFGSPVSVGHDHLGVSTPGQEIDVVEEVWTAIAADPVLDVGRVAVGTDEGAGEVSDYTISNNAGADDETLRLWTEAVTALESAPEEFVPRYVSLYGPADADVFPTSRLMTSISLPGRRASDLPGPEDAALRGLVDDFIALGATMEPDSSWAIGTAPASFRDFVKVYTGDRLADDPVSGRAGWPAYVRERLG